ncbi:uncharacterized protein LOC134229585 [Saccostrea cucullata]|uniref:uncharacterized protein LOC134229585 n=1 Tax=Saccostrea cuccullata TaxID=36930 RepID=UPI002ED4F83E
MAYKVDPGGRSRFAKLGMAINDELTQSCRDILEMEVPPALIFRKVKSSSLYQKLRPDQELILRNAAKSGYNEFDCTLLYMLLRNICSNFKIPTKGWGGNVMPAAGDVMVGDDIERIRLIRNNVYAHASSAFISQKIFDENWAIISDVCKRLETFTGKKYCDGLNKILAQSFDEEDEENIIEKIKSDCENDKSVRDVLSSLLAMMKEFRAAKSSKREGRRVKVLSIRLKAKEMQNNSQAITLSSMIKDTLNQMMDAINKKSTEEDICNLQSSFELYMDSISCDDDKKAAMNLLEKMKKTIHKYARKHPDKNVAILNNFVRFLSTLQQKYKLSDVHLEDGSILFRMTFASEDGYSRFSDDMKKGIVNQCLMDFFSDPYILSLVGLAEKDIAISITDLNEKEWKKIELHSIKERDIAQRSDSEDSSDESFVETSAGYRKFEEAKQCALDIFDSVGNLLSRVDDVFSGTPENIRDIRDIFKECRDRKSWFSESRKVLEKEKMKVVVLGSAVHTVRLLLSPVVQLLMAPTVAFNDKTISKARKDLFSHV